MGVTVHYRLIADDLKVVVAALRVVRREAEKAGYRYAELRDEGVAFMEVMPLLGDRRSTAEWLRRAWGGYAKERFEDVPEKPPFAWLEGDWYATPSFTWRWAADRTGFEGKRVKGEGIIVYCETAESFNLFFWKLGKYHVCSSFTKTQPLTVDEVEANIQYHKWVCGILRRIKKLPWWNFYVHDEAGYYESLDEEKLAENFEAGSKIIWEIASAIQDAADRAEPPVRSLVGGRHGVKKLRHQTRLEDHDRGQARLDEYFEGGGSGDKR